MADSQDKPTEPSQPDYEVGYGRPPKATQFKPGQSGNRKGRPKGAQNLTTLLEKELNSLVPVTENGRRKNVSKKKVMTKQLVNKAAAGDLKAAAMVFSQTGSSAPIVPTVAADSQASLAREDKLVLDNFLERWRRNEAQRAAGQGGPGDPAASGPPPDLTAPDAAAGEAAP